MFPLLTFVEYKHSTPSILGQSVVNPNIEDNRCLQRCLILASEGGHKIITNHKMGDESVCATSGGNNQTSTRCSE